MLKYILINYYNNTIQLLCNPYYSSLFFNNYKSICYTLNIDVFKFKCLLILSMSCIDITIIVY